MSDKINVGILGATGMVGQNYIRLLHNHPMFRVTHVAASPASGGCILVAELLKEKGYI
jgi:aspartate-semialdehyde dehydrogenase